MDDLRHGCMPLANVWLCCHWQTDRLRDVTLRPAPCPERHREMSRSLRLQALLMAQHRLPLEDALQAALATTWLDALTAWMQEVRWLDTRPAADSHRVVPLRPGTQSMK